MAREPRTISRQPSAPPSASMGLPDVVKSPIPSRQRQRQEENSRFVDQTMPGNQVPGNRTRVFSAVGSEGLTDDAMRARVMSNPQRYAGYQSHDGNYYAFRRAELFGNPNSDDDPYPGLPATHRNILSRLTLTQLVMALAQREFFIGGNPNVVFKAFGFNLKSLGGMHDLFPIPTELLVQLQSAEPVGGVDVDPLQATSEFSVAADNPPEYDED